MKQPRPGREQRRTDRAPTRLPLGVRDYLPEAAARRRAVTAACLGTFEHWGYRPVITPVFEYADVLARGSSTPQVRFVEPTTGEVVALRPDITPQIARLVATRLADLPGPIRLCYEGSVLRLLHGLGQRELAQAGIELIDAPQPEGDAEVLALAVATLAAAGIERPTIDVGHMGFLRQALEGLPAAVRQAIARKDAAAAAELARTGGLDGARRKLICALPRLYGEPAAVLREAKRLARGAGRAELDELEAALRTLEALQPAGTPAPQLTLDLGEVRGFDYYTGVRFAGYAEGHGDGLLYGGRYDDLCARYGRDARATGFAVEVDAVAEARAHAGARDGRDRAAGSVSPAGRGVVVTGPAVKAQRAALALRRRGEAAACGPLSASPAVLRDYALRWGFGRILLLSRAGANWMDLEGTRTKMTARECKELLGHG